MVLPVLLTQLEQWRTHGAGNNCINIKCLTDTSFALCEFDHQPSSFLDCLQQVCSQILEQIIGTRLARCIAMMEIPLLSITLMD